MLAIALTVLRPVVGGAVMTLAEDNPAALQLPFVRDIVAENLGDALVTPASTDPAQVEFLVEEGDTAKSIAARLEDEGLLGDRRTFVFIAIDRDLTGALQQGSFILRKNMTPDQLVSALLAPPPVRDVAIALRTGLRLEQITAKLQTLPLTMDPKEFYELAKSPPASLIDDYPWLKKILADAPKGASLEGFLWPATYRVLPETTPEELIRLMLDKFIANVGEQRLDVPKARGLNFYQVMALASIVEREAMLDEERPIIAGVYQNRIDGIPGRQEQDPQRRPDRLLRDRHDGARQAQVRRVAALHVLGAARRAARRGGRPRGAAGVSDLPDAGPHPGADRHAEPALDRRRAGARHGRQVHLLPGHPGRRREAAFAKTAAEHDENLEKYGYIQ